VAQGALATPVITLDTSRISSPAPTPLDCGLEDIARVRALVRRYADLSLGVVDAAVIACVERSGGRVMTFDLRDFGVVAAEGTITIVPQLPHSP
jgi:predicted nucleic acid-binding protein